MKKFYKSEKNKILAGVIGGMGEYFNIDPVLLRVVWIIVAALTGFIPALIAYIFAVIIVPKKVK